MPAKPDSTPIAWTPDEEAEARRLHAGGLSGPEVYLILTTARLNAATIALRTIAEMPIPEQDNMIAANMRRVAQDLLTNADA